MLWKYIYRLAIQIDSVDKISYIHTPSNYLKINSRQSDETFYKSLLIISHKLQGFSPDKKMNFKSTYHKINNMAASWVQLSSTTRDKISGLYHVYMH